MNDNKIINMNNKKMEQKMKEVVGNRIQHEI